MKKSKKQKLKEKCVKLATKIKLLEHPLCMFCGKKASTCHHFVHQGRSNFLRCDMRNLIPICQSCHYKLHISSEGLMGAILVKKLGKKWLEGMTRDSRIFIKDTLSYWQGEYEDLNNELESKSNAD